MATDENGVELDLSPERYLPIADYMIRTQPLLAAMPGARKIISQLAVPDVRAEKEDIAYTMLHGPQAPHYNAPLF